ncbi:MAG: methyltransferase domain-containing protein [bacterium]|nr:methyltransferase domain-containing protein [bacterium]
MTRKLVRMGGKATGIIGTDAGDRTGGRAGARFVHADMRRVKAKAGEYDLVVSSLAFHYIRNLDGLFKRCSKLLRSDGALIFSIHHPLSSFKMLQEQRKSKSVYFSVGESYRWRMLPGMELVSYHQTFESISVDSRGWDFIDRRWRRNHRREVVVLTPRRLTRPWLPRRSW